MNQYASCALAGNYRRRTVYAELINWSVHIPVDRSIFENILYAVQFTLHLTLASVSWVLWVHVYSRQVDQAYAIISFIRILIHPLLRSSFLCLWMSSLGPLERNRWEGEKRRARKQQGREREEKTGDAVGILPLSFSHRLPVVTALISCPRGTARTSHNSLSLCVYFPPWFAEYSSFLFWLWILAVFLSEFKCDDRCFSVSLPGNCIDHCTSLCIQYVKSDLCLVKLLLFTNQMAVQEQVTDLIGSKQWTTSAPFLIFPSCLFCFTTCFFLSHSTFLPHQTLSANLLSLLVLSVVFCLFSEAWEGGRGCSLAGDAACLRSSNLLLASLLISLVSLLRDFHRGNPIRIRQGPAGEGALPGVVRCVCGGEFMVRTSYRIKDWT